MLLWVDLTQFSFLLAAIIADGLSTALAIVLQYHPNTTERFTAEHTTARVELHDGLCVKDLWQLIFLFSVLVFQKDAVYFFRD